MEFAQSGDTNCIRFNGKERDAESGLDYFETGIIPAVRDVSQAPILQEKTGREEVQLSLFELYTLRHTCLRCWAPFMDPWTLAYLAGHRGMNITKRYGHPQEQPIPTARI